MIHTHRMVGSLCKLMNDSDVPFCLGGSLENQFAEENSVDDLGTGKGEYESAFCDTLNSICVQVPVADHRIFDCAKVFGKCGRIENDDIVLLLCIFQIVENIFLECVMICKTVQLRVSDTKLNGLIRT